MAGLGSILSVLRLLAARSDVLLPLLENLGPTMQRVGHGMQEAGGGAIATSRVLKGGPGTPVNMRQVATMSASAIALCYQQIRQAAQVIDRAGVEIGRVKVPTVTPTFTGLMGVQVVTGLDFGEEKLFGDVEEALKDGADNLSLVVDQLENVAAQLNNLAQALTAAGDGMYKAGDFLQDSGRELVRLSGANP